MNKKAFLQTLTAYTMWGLLPLYWKLLHDFSSLYVLANRIVFSCLFASFLLLIRKSLPTLITTIRNKQIMKYLIPASILVTINWGVYIYAVSSGAIQDASFGYYINPLFVSAFGILVFKERYTKYNIAAFVLALLGVVYLIIQLGRIPYLSLALGLSFTLYGACKKYAHMDSILSVAIETLLITPIAILFLIFSNTGKDSLVLMTPTYVILFILSGVLTSVPLMLYANGVNELPFVTVGFLQYIGPTLMLIISLMEGEPFHREQFIGFSLIWAALIVFSIGMTKKDHSTVSPP